MASDAINLSTPLDEILRARRLSTVYQPIVSAGDGALFAHEALLRGPEASRLTTPMELFAASHEAGRSGELDLLALQMAVERFAAGQFRGKLFVNVLPQTLSGFDGFGDWLAGTLRERGVPPERLVIEVTEHGQDVDFRVIREQAGRLHSIGCEIAIDDLGAGLSGLKTWSELRPDYVKVDRYFTAQLEEDPIAIEILHAMLDIAHVLGSRVIAEGVENDRQQELLRGIGVDYLQGHYIARPSSDASYSTGKFAARPQWTRGAEGVACVGDLCVSRIAVRSDAKIADAVALFQEHPDWETLPVVSDERPVGILRRDALLLLLSRPLFPEVYNPKPVSRVMDAHALVIDERTRLNQASRLITRDRHSRTNEDFIIARDGRYVGLGHSIEVLHHITEQKLHEAHHSNPLTLLPGNREIDAFVRRLLALRTPFAICHADIDHFKPFNDEYGYSRGDQVLLHLAGLCRSAAVNGLDFVGHPGGDDFILVMRSQDWQHRIAKIVDSFAASCARFYSDAHRTAGGFMGHDRDGNARMFPLMTLSVGAATVDADGQQNPTELMHALSVAKQRAKSRHGNVVILRDAGEDQTVRLCSGATG